MLRWALYFLGMLLHRVSYLRVGKSGMERVVILMGGPSVDETEFDSGYDCSITSNLTAPASHCSLINADTYFHCFSDPSIVENQKKREIFKDILAFSSENKNYRVIIPVQYLQYVDMWGEYYRARVLVYNQYSTWVKRKRFCLSRFVFPNMKTIFLDCALPWVVCLGAKKVFVAGFDADYGGGVNKNYSKVSTDYIEKNNVDRTGWGRDVLNSADMYLQLILCWYDCKIVFAQGSGYARYRRSNVN